jgi:hypothetical protein
VRLFRSGLAASHHHLSTAGLEAGADPLWGQRLCAPAPALGLALVYWPAQPHLVGAARLQPPTRVGLERGAPAPFGEASLAAWVAALLAPSSGAAASWGFWGAPLYA